MTSQLSMRLETSHMLLGNTCYPYILTDCCCCQEVQKQYEKKDEHAEEGKGEHEGKQNSLNLTNIL